MKGAAPVEVKCEACNGSGFPTVMQPAKQGRRIYPAPCKVCGGKGRIARPAARRTKAPGGAEESGPRNRKGRS
jgi:DnaJ-class molecular chaperone